MVGGKRAEPIDLTKPITVIEHDKYGDPHGLVLDVARKDIYDDATTERPVREAYRRLFENAPLLFQIVKSAAPGLSAVLAQHDGHFTSELDEQEQLRYQRILKVIQDVIAEIEKNA